MTSPLLVVGSVAFDTVRTPFGSRDEVLGGSATYFSMAASFFYEGAPRRGGGERTSRTRTRLPLRERGVGSRRSHADPRAAPSDGKANTGTTSTPRRPCAPSWASSPASGRKLAETLRESEFVFLANIDPEIQLEVLDQVKRPRSRRVRHHELLDRGEARRPAQDPVEGRRAPDQRREARQLAGEPNPRARRRGDPPVGTVHHRRQARRIRGRHVLRGGSSAFPPIRSRASSIPRARGTRSRAVSWDTSRGTAA